MVEVMVYDLDGNVPENYDLTKGYLQPKTVIKPDAIPPDDVTKFAWDDDDYEEIQIYIPYESKNSEPTQLDRIEAQVAYTAMMTGTLMEG